jgi:hypothetical protein
MDYKDKYLKYKYLKYKNKYINLKNQFGGLNCDDKIVYRNTINSCWMIAIQMIFLFGDKTSDIIQMNLKKDIGMIINQSINFKYLPDIFFIDNDYTKGLYPENSIKIFLLLKILQKRFLNIESYETNNTHKLWKKYPYYQKEIQCEISFAKYFFELFNKSRSVSDSVTGDYYDLFFLTLIICVFLYDKMIYFEECNTLCFKKNLLYDKIIGVVVTYPEHISCFYKCNNISKYYNDANKEVLNFNYELLFDILQKLSHESRSYRIFCNLFSENDVQSFTSEIIKKDLAMIHAIIPNILPFIVTNTDIFIYAIETQTYISKPKDKYTNIFDIESNYDYFQEITNFVFIYDTPMDKEEYMIEYIDKYIKYYKFNNISDDNIIAFITNNKIDLNRKNKYNHTPLYDALTMNSYNIAKIFIANGALLENVESSLGLVLMHDNLSLELFRLIIDTMTLSSTSTTSSELDMKFNDYLLILIEKLDTQIINKLSLSESSAEEIIILIQIITLFINYQSANNNIYTYSENYNITPYDFAMSLHLDLVKLIKGEDVITPYIKSLINKPIITFTEK